MGQTLSEMFYHLEYNLIRDVYRNPTMTLETLRASWEADDKGEAFDVLMPVLIHEEYITEATGGVLSITPKALGTYQDQDLRRVRQQRKKDRRLVRQRGL